MIKPLYSFNVSIVSVDINKIATIRREVILNPDAGADVPPPL